MTSQLNEEDLKSLKWDIQCNQGCGYDPYPHSHDFKLGRDQKKKCDHCSDYMYAETQIYGAKPEENKALLINKLKCKCGKACETHLYNGLLKSFKEIYMDAEYNYLNKSDNN